MPTTSFPLSYLRRLTDISPQQLEQQAFDYGLEATLRDDFLDVEITAERPDLLAAEGFIRAINIYNQHPRTLPDHLEPSGRTITVLADVLPLRPYIAALVVENARLGEDGLTALIEFQEKATQTFGRQRKKIAIGLYNLDQVTGNLTYTAASKRDVNFTPLASTQPLTADQILTEHPNGKLYSHTLPPGDTVLVLKDSADQVLSLPPIINAAGIGEISAETQTLLIDVTGISEKTVLEMVNILAHNFLDTGATVKTVTIDHPQSTQITPSIARTTIPYSAKLINEVLGTAIPKQDLGQYLSRMDLQVLGTDQALVPSYRTDIFSDVDIAGDLLVAIGIDNLKTEPTAPRFYTGSADRLKEFVFRVGDVAQRMGLMEVKSLMLTDPDILDLFNAASIQADNAKNRTLSATRGTLQAGLLEILSRNINAPKPINVYEVGEVIVPDSTFYETYYWGFASLDDRASFATAKAYVQTLLKALKIPYELIVCQHQQYIPGRAASVMVSGRYAGHFGEIHPSLLHRFSFPEPICSGELDCKILL